MSEVKTYAVNCNDAWLNTDGDDISGSYVKYADYIALATKLDLSERACAELAAENAVLKTAHPQPFGPEMMKALDAYEKHHDEVPETGMLNAFFILRDSIRIETPATDAFLAEVRAQGGAKALEDFAEFNIKSIDPFDDEYTEVLKETARAARCFAAQLRKGGEQK